MTAVLWLVTVLVLLSPLRFWMGCCCTTTGVLDCCGGHTIPSTLYATDSQYGGTATLTWNSSLFNWTGCCLVGPVNCHVLGCGTPTLVALHYTLAHDCSLRIDFKAFFYAPGGAFCPVDSVCADATSGTVDMSVWSTTTNCSPVLFTFTQDIFPQLDRQRTVFCQGIGNARITIGP